MELQNKLALVTGANGFVGTFTTKRLIQEGVRVRALVRSPEAAKEVAALGAEPVLGDISDAKAMSEAVAGTQLVVHCALTLSMDLDENRRINVAGTDNLVQAALAAGCERFVYISTISVYDHQNRNVINEDTPLVTQADAYSVAKVEAEGAVRAAMAKGLPAVILRPPFILGNHPRSFWNTIHPASIKAGEFPLVDGGACQFPYVHVANLADAITLALGSDAAVGQTFNVVDGQTTWRRYVEHFRTEPLPSMAAEEHWNFMSIRGQFSGARVNTMLGYAPQRTFEDAMSVSAPS